MLETNTGKLMVAFVLVLGVSAATLAGIGFLEGGEDGGEDTTPPWEHPVCTGTAQSLTTQNTTTATPPGDRTVLTSGPSTGVNVEIDEQNESVTFVIVTPGRLKLAYIAGDHRYQNYPLVCERVITLSRDELKENGELHLVGTLREAESEAKFENGTRVLTRTGADKSVVQSIEYDFRENISNHGRKE
jgi:hypothetical protein